MDWMDWMYWVTAIIFTALGYFMGQRDKISYDVRSITQNVIDQLEALGLVYKIINDEGEEELVPHPQAIADD